MNILPSTRRVPVTVALALLILSSGLAHAQERQPDCYIVSAGVDNYPSVGKLQGCLSDARNTTAAFAAQQGKLFRQVHAQTLLDGQATHGRILQEMYSLQRRGAAGDFVVLFLSGHGGRTPDNRAWFFLPYDYHSQRHGTSALTDRQILDAAHALVEQNKKVFVIVDACYAGQLHESARAYFPKYRNPQAGGLALLLSSRADQTSTALGQYSAFAKAFADSMVSGDLNRDGQVTLDEIRRDSFQRTHNLIKQHGMNARQDSQVTWSPSINANMPLALLRGAGPITQPQPPTQIARSWSGSETLQGYGRLAFELHQGGRAVMHDTAGASEGVWQVNGNQVTLQFANGRIVYSGTVQGNTISGAARNQNTNWTFNVASAAAAPQPQPQAAGQIWTGNESLAGFGQLAFHLHNGGRAVMHDAAGASEGRFDVRGNQVTLTFANGRVVYTGTLQGNTISGEARNERTTWTFRVTHTPTTASLR